MIEAEKSSKLWLIAVLVIVVVIAGAFTFFAFNKQTSIVTSNEKTSIGLDFEFSKSIKVGEPVVLDYQVKYDGKPFKGLVLYTYSREGFDEKHFDKASGKILSDEPAERPLILLTPFRLNKEGFSSGSDYFQEEGVYTYTISIYDCQDIEKRLAKTCDVADSIQTEELLALQPLISNSQDITVKGGQFKPECKDSSDCTKICEGCTEGKQICEQGKEVCMDCFMDLQCKDGYACKENKCVKK